MAYTSQQLSSLTSALTSLQSSLSSLPAGTKLGGSSNALSSALSGVSSSLGGSSAPTSAPTSAPSNSGYNSLSAADKAAMAAVQAGNAPSSPAVQNALATGSYGGVNYGGATPAQPSASPTAPTGNTNYIVRSGDSLSAIAARNGLTLAQVKQLNPQYSSNWDLIRPGDNIVLSTNKPVLSSEEMAKLNDTTEKVRVDTETQRKAEEAKRNAEESARIKALADLNTEIDTKNKLKMLTDLDSSLGIKEPTVPSYTSKLNELEQAEGIDSVEAGIAEIDKQIAEAKKNRTARLRSTEGMLAPGEIIRGRTGIIDQTETDLINSLIDEKNALVSRYTSKMNAIQTTMNWMKTDYETSKSAYDSAYTKAFNMQAYADKETDKVQADAKANLTYMINTMQEAGVTYKDWDSATLANIRKLEIQAGYPAGFTESYALSSPSTKMLFSTTNKDTGLITVVGQKGSEIVTMGTVQGSPTTSESDKATSKYTGYKTWLDQVLKSGGGTKVLEKDWNMIRSRWITEGMSQSDFDSKFKEYAPKSGAGIFGD